MKLYRAAIISVLLGIGSVACSGTSSEVEDGSDAVTSARAPLARFAPYLKVLHDNLDNAKTTESAAKALLQSGRVAAFNLQALCRLYKDQDPEFKKMQNKFKDLEDGIGDFDKWDDIYNAAVSAKSSTDTLARLKKNRDDALATFTKMLEDDEWRLADPAADPADARLTKIDTFLKTFKWQRKAQDRALVLDGLIKELNGISTTQYDITHLEEGNGVHELRRDIRWVLMEQGSLNGMVVFRDDDTICPIPGYAKLINDPIAKSKYAQLTPSTVETKPCKVSRCLVLAGTKLVEDIGAIKDSVEVGNNIKGDSDLVPEQSRAAVEKLHSDMVNNKLVQTLAGELQACKAAL